MSLYQMTMIAMIGYMSIRVSVYRRKMKNLKASYFMIDIES